MARHFDMQRAWDAAASTYQARRPDQAPVVRYGALAPDETHLHLLGDVAGLRVLDLGCGGGQAAVALALAGADVTALDVSDQQLVFARRLAESTHAAVTFIHAEAAAAPLMLTPGFDLILAAHVLPYLDSLPTTLRSCRALLRPCGRLVASLDHPLRTSFIERADGEESPYPVQPYFGERLQRWSFAAGLPMRSRHLPLADWLDHLHRAGLQLIRLVEPPVPADLADELWPADSPLAPLRLLPHTLIIIAANAGN